MAAGASHTVAVKTDGTLWAWGYNYYGQLGDGTAWRETPIQIGAPVVPVPVIQVQPTSLSFLPLLVNLSSTQACQVVNLGGLVLTGSVAVLPPFYVVSGSPFSVAASQTGLVQVAFSPTSAGTFTNNLVFTSNGGNRTNGVSGTGARLPVAMFSADRTNGSVPLAVTFTDTSTGTITNRVWSFGDGATNSVLTNVVAHTYNLAGIYTVGLTAYGPLGSGSASKSNYIVVTNTMTLGEALNAPLLPWSTGGNAAWIPQTSVTHDGVGAAQSGAITSSQESWVETTVVGPGTLTFWWKVSSEQGFDYLEFYVNGLGLAFVAGEVSWQQESFTLASGVNTLRWRYVKDDITSVGQDRGWLDEVSFALAKPLITGQPQNQTVMQGAGAGFSVAAAGAAPLRYQWWFKGAALSGATTNSYSILAAATNQAGSYWVVVTNGLGSATSDVASLTVLVPPSIVTPPRSQIIPPGSNVTFTVLAAGTAPLSYQWRAHGTNLGGATGTALSLLSLTTNDAGGYVVVVTNWAGSVTSAVATLQVREWLRFLTEGGVMGMLNGSFRLRLVGMAQTSAVVIEASTNLVNWVPLYTNPGPSTLIKYSDPAAINQIRRFYRAVEIP